MDKKLLEILEDIQPEANYLTCKDLIDGHYLDSLSILALVAELEEEYDIPIPTVEIVPVNFNSAQAIWELVQRLQEEG